MSPYRVIDVRPDQRLAALRDDMGRKYVVRLNAEIPPIAAELRGNVLRAGQATLLTDRTGQVFDITTDAVECDEQYMLERLHPPLGAAPRPVPRNGS